MADNHNRGSSDAFRRRQESRRRRQPQTIDEKAQDVTTSPLSDPAEPGPQQSDPVSEAPLGAETASHEAADSPRPGDRDAPPAGADLPVVPPSPAFSPAADGLAQTDPHRSTAAAIPGSVTDPATRSEPLDHIDHPVHAEVPAPSPEGIVADPLPWSVVERRSDEPVVAADDNRPTDPLASGEPVPVSEFVRTPQSETPEPAPPSGVELQAGPDHPTEADAPSAEPGFAAAAPVPMSEFVRSPAEPPEAGAPPGEPGHEPDRSSVPLSSSSDPDAVLGAAPPFSGPALSRDGAERFEDTAPASPAAAPDRRTSFVPAGLAALALLIIAGLAGIYYGLKLGDSAGLAAKVDALTERVATLEARPAPPTSPVDLGALQTRSTALDGDVAALKTAIADLSAKLEQATRAAAENGGRIATLEQHAATAPNAPPASAAENVPPPAAESSAPPAESSPAPALPAPAVPAPAAPAPATTPTIVSPPVAAGSGDTGAAPVAAAPPPVGSEPAEVTADLAALTGKVEDLAKRLAALPTEAPAPTDLAPLQGRISDLAARLEAQQAAVAALPKVDEARLDTRLTGLDQKVDQTGGRIAEVAQAVAAIPKLDLGPLQASIADVDTRLKPVEVALAAPKAGDQVTEARAVGSTEESRAAPLAVVAGAISRALNEGRPFAPELDALRGLGIEDAALGPLPVLAGPGAPTSETLRDRWTDIQTKVLTAAGPKTGDSVLDRFAAGARTLVQVRQVGAAPGDDPSAASARIGAALERGDIADALGEWAKLPEASRTASQGWADAARSRLEADASVQALMVRAISALAPPKN